jgi:hypothetical protein
VIQGLRGRVAERSEHDSTLTHSRGPCKQGPWD